MQKQMACIEVCVEVFLKEWMFARGIGRSTRDGDLLPKNPKDVLETETDIHFAVRAQGCML